LYAQRQVVADWSGVLLWTGSTGITPSEPLASRHDRIPEIGFNISLRLDGLSLMFGTLIRP
jgi:hypothetical protein